MTGDPLWAIFVNACLINNFVLAYFLGICPFLGVSGKLATATRMGGAVTFVMLVSSMAAFGINSLLLLIDAPYLKLISFIAVIASTVQLVEMFLRKFVKPLYTALGIFLPLITTNCAVMGTALNIIRDDCTFIECIVVAIASASGFTLALILMAGIRERLEISGVPRALRGTAIGLITAGLMALAFVGFRGVDASLKALSG